MKKNILLLLAFTSFGFNASPDKDIIGVWKYSESIITQKVDATLETLKQQNPTQISQVEATRPEIEKMVRSTELEFKLDSTYEIRVPNSPVKIGKYYFEDNYKLMIREVQPGNKSKYLILEITPNSMIMVNVAKKDTIVYVKSSK